MTITKKQWMMLLLGAGVLFLVYWFFFRKKNTESSYDENLMIFGNENGYTNYELDGGERESAYGPMFGALGSYGNESSLTGRRKSTIIVERKAGKCDCDHTASGICFKSEKGVLGCTTSILAGVRDASTTTTAALGKQKSLKERCEDANGKMGTCYKPGSNVGYPCCSMANVGVPANTNLQYI